MFNHQNSQHKQIKNFNDTFLRLLHTTVANEINYSSFWFAFSKDLEYSYSFQIYLYIHFLSLRPYCTFQSGYHKFQLPKFMQRALGVNLKDSK